ncbi:MAG: phenylalanine--tRNA ligase subunit beta [Pirellulaceae bacterium]
MDVSWEWLQQYVSPKCSLDEVTDRLTMSGLNHESTTAIDHDFCIDLEVTSNRPDCLGHLGVAREVAILADCPLQIPEVKFAESDEDISKLCSVVIECPELCRRYTARLVRGVKIGPSPEWLARRLRTIGITPINNVVDISNYVMMECGQPLHTFDFGKLAGGKIVVREPKPNEKIAAIDHNEYGLVPGMCVIADATKPVAIGGVMGGAETEINNSTRDVLIEAAWFAPGSVRSTARKLNLHSDSSFRFERNTDIEALEWASRRCAQLIAEIAGGKVAKGCIDINLFKPERKPVSLRPTQIERILGIAIPTDFVRKVLAGLGVQIQQESADEFRVLCPSWRKDLSREIDLIEEIGRLYGYDKVPDNVTVAMAPSYKSSQTRMIDKVRRVLSAAGFDEAMCPSLLPEPWSKACSPWTDREPFISHQPMLGVLEKGSQNVGAVNCLRRTLIPSLLEAKRINEYRSNPDIDLFEIAHVYLPKAEGLPQEPLMLGLVSGRDFAALKGLVETLLRELNPEIAMRYEASKVEIFDINRSATIQNGETMIGHLGQISAAGKKMFGLRQNTTVVELDLSFLATQVVDVRRHQAISEFPAVKRDFNFILAESTPWVDLEKTVRDHAGPLLESIQFRETFRDEKRDGAGKKRILLSLQLRSKENTLSGPQVESVCDAVVQACQSSLGATLAS